MAVTWTPSDADLVTVSKPNAVPTITLSATDSTGGIDPVYEVLTNTCPATISVAVGALGITVSGNTLESFPPSAILYVVGTVQGSSATVQGVPVDADPYKYQANPATLETYTIQVKVTFDNLVTSTKSYTLTATNSWNADKAAVQSLMERYA